MDTHAIRRLCDQIDKARAMATINVEFRHIGGDEKKPKKAMLDVDVALGSGFGGQSDEQTTEMAGMLARVWVEPLREVENRAIHELRRVVNLHRETAQGGTP